jgi:hypothetical protein
VGTSFVDFRQGVLSWSVGSVMATGTQTVNLELETAHTNTPHIPAVGSGIGVSHGGADSSMESL